MKSLIDYVMNSEKNPLKNLQPARRFQVMLFLSIMWTTIFCVGTSAWLWFDELLVAHTLMAFGVLATGYTFTSAKRVKTYRDHPRADGTARYDDVWGA